jgi:hypothetical protein
MDDCLDFQDDCPDQLLLPRQSLIAGLELNSEYDHEEKVFEPVLPSVV